MAPNVPMQARWAAEGRLKFVFELGLGVAEMGPCCAIFVNHEPGGPDRTRKTKLPASFRKRRELWERWCEAGKNRVSLQGPMPDSNARDRISARRFSGQHGRIAYSKPAIKH